MRNWKKQRHAAAVAVPASPLPDGAPSRGEWLGTTGKDDLTRIRGIDSRIETRLAEAGVHNFTDIEKLRAQGERDLEHRIDIPDGAIASQQWREQAALLRQGKDAEFDSRFGPAARR